MANDVHVTDDMPRYTPNAAARNMLVDNCLKPRHTHVLWMDVDLVKVPPDLIERLFAVSENDVVAPLVYVEKVDKSAVASDGNGGWFYDTGAFVHEGRATQRWGPTWMQNSGAVEMDSVGTCYVIPADVYRSGARYSAEGVIVEHIPLLAEARAMGYKVYADCDTRIEHAYLPKYGEMWHSTAVVRYVSDAVHG